MLKIVPFTNTYNRLFKDLNLAWISEYFFVEAKDEELLENAQSSIIAKGGYIFIGLWNDKPVSCFSLLKEKNGVYELGKMAVSKPYQGHQIGQKLLSFAINFARAEGWQSLFLYSNTKLKSAIHIYQKHGFKEIPLEKEVIYKRSNIKMLLTLD